MTQAVNIVQGHVNVFNQAISNGFLFVPFYSMSQGLSEGFNTQRIGKSLHNTTISVLNPNICMWDKKISGRKQKMHS